MIILGYLPKETSQNYNTCSGLSQLMHILAIRHRLQSVYLKLAQYCQHFGICYISHQQFYAIPCIMHIIIVIKAGYIGPFISQNKIVMQESRGFHSEKADRSSPKREDPETPVKKTKKNAVQASKKHEKSTTSPLDNKMPASYPKLELLQEKTVKSEEIRIKGQEKLHYIKQCRQKKLSAQQIFDNYPFSTIESFKFEQEHIRGEDGELTAKIVEDEQGLHLVEEYGKISPSKYITKAEEQEENSFNGLSVSIFNDGGIFEGNYHNGRFCGLGLELQANGNTFIGLFKQGVKTGFGTFYWFSNSQLYAGEWLGGLPHGSGVYIAKDKYEGHFANGLKHGFGEERFLNGDTYVGEYVNSVADGYGEYYWTDGSVYKGDFKQGVRHGYGIWKDENETFKGHYRLDRKEGFGIYKWNKKQVYKGEFKDDFREGYGELYGIGKEEDKLVYAGCWGKGKREENAQIDEAKVKQLYVFLEKTDGLDHQIEQNSKAKKKERVGHRNCIPNELSPHRHT